MTNIDDVINRNINKYAGAMEALAKGDEMKSFVPDELWDERMRLMSAQPIEAIDAWTKAAKMVSELKIQLAARDALIERLVEAGRLLCDYAILVSVDHPMGDGQMAKNDKAKWDALVAEYRASKDGGE